MPVSPMPRNTKTRPNQSITRVPSSLQTPGINRLIFLFVLYSTLLHLPPLGFPCVRGCWGSNTVLLRFWHWQSGAMPLVYDMTIKICLGCTVKSIRKVFSKQTWGAVTCRSLKTKAFLWHFPFKKKFYRRVKHIYLRVSEDEHQIHRVLLSCSQLNRYSLCHCSDRPTISGVHSIMMEKSAEADEGGGCHCTPTPFHSSYHHVQSCSVPYIISWIQ